MSFIAYYENGDIKRLTDEEALEYEQDFDAAIDDGVVALLPEDVMTKMIEDVGKFLADGVSNITLGG